MYQSKIEQGKKYNVLKPSICILIADYKLKDLKHIPEYHTVWNLRERKYNNKILSPDIEIHILEIPKIKDDEMLKDELALWLKFIENPKNKEVENNMFFHENELYKQAKEELAYLSDDPDFHELVEARTWFLLDQNTYKDDARNEGLAEGRRKGLKEGWKEGRKEGRKEGQKEEKIEIAKKLIKLKMPTEQIIEITELTNEEIEEILNEDKQKSKNNEE